MSKVEVTIYDPDTKQADRAARRLRTSLKNEGVASLVSEVTCYLEISRQGLKGKTPVISVNGVNFKCKNLSDSLLDEFAKWVSRN
ncbi:hypothetical protein [Maridesulfovibrio sp.]|uniref:hypothetical protein n=1 Tax=Maridesulfovibrio sp. TaxID=2795000 RepID=UPI0029F59A48|nr:hypothetical protein [Maridesulfovibrio sp.]